MLTPMVDQNFLKKQFDGAVKASGAYTVEERGTGVFVFKRFKQSIWAIWPAGSKIINLQCSIGQPDPELRKDLCEIMLSMNAFNARKRTFVGGLALGGNLVIRHDVQVPLQHDADLIFELDSIARSHRFWVLMINRLKSV